MLEILAPAGNAACAKAAIDNGANAIYLGYSAFSARQSAENFDKDSLSKTVEYAHLCGAKVYVAMNTLVKKSETETFLQTLSLVWSAGVDAVILQDILLGKAVKEAYPQIVLHLSTQAGVCNENGAKFAKECGFSRVILARETPLLEMQKIAKIIETEAFVQGALCTAFSGQCYFSSFAGGNSGNRGRCKQPCRKLYTYNRNGFEEKSYALSLSDLSVGEEIQKYIEAGVTSFKIEGRMRRAEYVAAAVRYYKAILNERTSLEKSNALSDLKRTYNRGNYTSGLAFGQDKRFLSRNVQGHLGEKVGVVKVQNGKFFVESAFKPCQGDAFKILRDGKEVGGATFLKTEGKGFVLFSKTRLKNGDNVFITTDTKVNERVLTATKKTALSLSLFFAENELAKAQGGGVEVLSSEPLQTANSRALTKQELIECFSKTDGLPLDIEFERVEINGNIFIPKSQLNALRRSFYEEICKKARNERGEISSVHFSLPSFVGRNEKTAVIASDFTGFNPEIAIYKPNDYTQTPPESFINGKFEKYIYYPPFCTGEDEKRIEELVKDYALDGVYAENYGALAFAKETGVKVFAGTGLNITNSISLATLLKMPNVKHYAVSKELSDAEKEPLLSEKAFSLSFGGIKVMDLCYCPFGKTCSSCDKKTEYVLTDEHGRAFPVRRFVAANGACRFEVYNCASLIDEGKNGAGQLLDFSLQKEKPSAYSIKNDVEKQKTQTGEYTSGHAKRGVL